MQGVGETLRGTLNSSVDRRFGAPQATVDQHDAISAAGRSEIDTGRFHDSVKEREKAHTIGKVMRKPVNPQTGAEEGRGDLRVVNQ